MHDDGFQDILSVDFSPACVDFMRQRNAVRRPALKFKCADVREDLALAEGAFDLVLDKAGGSLCYSNLCETLCVILASCFKILHLA